MYELFLRDKLLESLKSLGVTLTDELYQEMVVDIEEIGQRTIQDENSFMPSIGIMSLIKLRQGGLEGGGCWTFRTFPAEDNPQQMQWGIVCQKRRIPLANVRD